MIDTAVRLFQRDGYEATSWRALVREAGTPWGSVQHHFPGGKEELGVSAVDAAAHIVRRTIAKAFRDHDDPVTAVRWWFGIAATVLEAGGFRSGCFLATVALEKSHESAPITAAIDTAFRSWLSQIEQALVEHGVEPRPAAGLALQILVTLEGALLLGRVLADGEVVRASAAYLEPALMPARRQQQHSNLPDSETSTQWQP